jgi:hypothetical protein
MLPNNIVVKYKVTVRLPVPAGRLYLNFNCNSIFYIILTPLYHRGVVQSTKIFVAMEDQHGIEGAAHLNIKQQVCR